MIRLQLIVVNVVTWSCVECVLFVLLLSLKGGYLLCVSDIVLLWVRIDVEVSVVLLCGWCVCMFVCVECDCCVDVDWERESGCGWRFRYVGKGWWWFVLLLPSLVYQLIEYARAFVRNVFWIGNSVLIVGIEWFVLCLCVCLCCDCGVYECEEEFDCLIVLCGKWVRSDTFSRLHVHVVPM